MMKTLKQILIVCAMTLAFSNANAQDANNPWVMLLKNINFSFDCF